MARITIYKLGHPLQPHEPENDVIISLPLIKPLRRPAPPVQDEPPAASGEPTIAPEATPAARDSTDGSSGSAS